MLRMIVAAAIATLAGPALAESASRHVWLDIECRRVVMTPDGQNYYYTRPDAPMTACVLASKGKADANLTCEDGTKPKVELMADNRTVIVDGVELNFYEGPLPCGAGGVEWPD